MSEYITTFTGNRFYFARPTFSVIELADVAVALSRMPRFTCHSSSVYTVAEHSIAVALECLVRARRAGYTSLEAKRVALCGLLHDAAEAYVGDITSPLKRHLGIKKAIKPIEDAVELALVGPYVSERDRAIAHDHFVKPADRSMLLWERANFMPSAQTETWIDLEVAEEPCIGVDSLVKAMPPSKRFAFYSLHEALVNERTLPGWTFAAGAEVANA